jgi:hypothetical protein
MDQNVHSLQKAFLDDRFKLMLNVYKKNDRQKDRTTGWILGPKQGGLSKKDRWGWTVITSEV